MSVCLSVCLAVNIVTVVLHVAYWRVDWQGQFVSEQAIAKNLNPCVRTRTLAIRFTRVDSAQICHCFFCDEKASNQRPLKICML